MAGSAQKRSGNLSPQDFVDAVAEPASEFDKEWKLQGHYSIHWMGFATSPDSSQLAACVVFKPSASPWYLQPRDEKCTLLMMPNEDHHPEENSVPDADEVQLGILQHLAGIADTNSITTDTDIKIIRVAIKMINELFHNYEDLLAWAESAEELIALFESDNAGLPEENNVFATLHQDQPAPGAEAEATQDRPATVESCEICLLANKAALLEITDDGRKGKCATGHEFFRCGITFLAIQDPEVGKFCVKCGRQFLCIDQIESEGGPSVARTLLDECGEGLCPYCQGYFCDA
jgi:hypothetical protein